MAEKIWPVLAIMVFSGVAGGVVNVALSPPEDRSNHASWGWGIIAGVGAAFLIPLFLRTVDSSLLSGLLSGKEKPEDYLVFTAFCLLAAISSKAFIQTLSDKVLREIRKTREEVKESRAEAQKANDTADKAQDVARIAQDAAQYGLGNPLFPDLKKVISSINQTDPKSKSTLSMLAELEKVEHDFPEILPGQDADDPWAGQFGGKSEANKRRLEAIIKPLDNRAEWCSIKLTVRSTNPIEAPLEGKVRFYLHTTFPNFKPIVPVVRGVAELNISAWGAFTVGVQADKGQTLLELDLSEHPDAQEPWRSR